MLGGVIKRINDGTTQRNELVMTFYKLHFKFALNVIISSLR